MNKCKCGKEIKEAKKMCFNCFKTMNNMRIIRKNEIVIDCDTRPYGDLGIIAITNLMAEDGYRIEVYKAKGQKSGHGHIKDIPEIGSLDKHQRKTYKELLLKKYIEKSRKLFKKYNAKEMNKVLDEIDFSLCGKHLIAEPNKKHYKYNQTKQLVKIINPSKENFLDTEVFKQAKEGIKPNTNIKNSKVREDFKQSLAYKISQKISIIDIADQYGLKPLGSHKRICPFHPDSKPSLVLYENTGTFLCYSDKCGVSGNIIKFVYELKKLNSDFEVKVKCTN